MNTRGHTSTDTVPAHVVPEYPSKHVHPPCLLSDVPAGLTFTQRPCPEQCCREHAFTLCSNAATRGPVVFLTAAAHPAPLVSDETRGAGGWAAALSVLGEAHRVTGVRVVGLTCVIGVNVIRVAHVISTLVVRFIPPSYRVIGLYTPVYPLYMYVFTLSSM